MANARLLEDSSEGLLHEAMTKLEANRGSLTTEEGIVPLNFHVRIAVGAPSI